MSAWIELIIIICDCNHTHIIFPKTHVPCFPLAYWPLWDTPSWPEWSTAWQSQQCCASRPAPAPHQDVAGHRMQTGKQQSTLSCLPPGTTEADFPPAQHPWTPQRTAWHPGKCRNAHVTGLDHSEQHQVVIDKSNLDRVLDTKQHLSRMKELNVLFPKRAFRYLVEFVLLAKLHTLSPAVVALVKISSNTPELDQVMLL